MRRGGAVDRTGSSGFRTVCDRLTQAPPARLAEDMHLLAGLVGFTVLVAAWSFPIWSDAVPFVCPLRVLTGIPCPACGATRAVVAASRGELIAALRLNPLAGILAGVLSVYTPWALAAAAGGWRRPRLPDAALHQRRVLGLVAGGLVLMNWLAVVLVGAV